jgi:hypothetical protein
MVKLFVGPEVKQFWKGGGHRRRYGVALRAAANSGHKSIDAFSLERSA